MTEPERLLPPAADLTRVPAERELVSFHISLEKTKRFLSLKTRTKDGRQEVLLLSARIALHLRDKFQETLRARKGLAELPKNAEFFDNIPEHVAEDWNTESSHVGVPLGAHVETGKTGCILAFPLDRDGRYTAFGMSALHAAYFLHAINDLEKNEGFDIPVVSAAAGSDQVH